MLQELMSEFLMHCSGMVVGGLCWFFRYSMMIRYHDGIDYMRTACVVAVEKARDWFQPLIERLSLRCEHIMRRLCPVIDHIVNKDGQGAEHAGYR